MNGYRQGSITEKLNKLKANHSQKPLGTLPFDPSINIVGSMIGKPNQALPINSTSSLIPQFTNPAPIAKTNVPIVTKPKTTGIVPPPPAPSIPPEKDQTKNNQNPIIPTPQIEKKEEKSDTDANFLASLIGQGFAMMGAGIRGGDPGQVGNQISQTRFNQEKYASEEEQRKLLNKERLDQIERAKRLLDPQSEESKQKRMTYGKALGLNIPESTTAADLENSDFLRSLMHDKDMQSKMALENQKLSLKGMNGGNSGKKEKGLTEGQRIRLDNASLAYKALKDMKEALKSNNTFSVFGDNDYTEARRRFAEGFGRMQSGGVIGKDEIANFESMAPKYTDSKEMQEKKLRNLELEINSRIKQIGSDPDEMYLERTGYNVKGNRIDFSDEDRNALRYAKENPDNPYSKEILKRLGVK